MEVLNFENAPALWYPIWVLSEPMLSGSETNFGTNLNASGNRFFLNARHFVLSRDDDEDSTVLQMCATLASDRPEPGFVTIVHDGHLKVVGEEIDGMFHPAIWNARLLNSAAEPKGEDFYKVFSEGKKVDGRHVAPIPVGRCLLAYSAESDVVWNAADEAVLKSSL